MKCADENHGMVPINAACKLTVHHWFFFCIRTHEAGMQPMTKAMSITKDLERMAS